MQYDLRANRNPSELHLFSDEIKSDIALEKHAAHQ
jgi:hypothetical protein